MDFFYTPDYSEWSAMAGQKAQRALISSWLVPRETRDLFGMPASACFLLHGPDGCGKTHFAMAVGARLSKLGWQYAQIDASALLMEDEKDTAEQINAFYETIEAVNRVVFLVTGVEQFPAGAPAAWFSAAIERLISPDSERICFLEARDPEDLTPAIAGLGRPVCMDLPNAEERKEKMQKMLEDSGFKLDVAVSLDRVSEITEGCTFRDLEAVMASAKGMLLHKTCRSFASPEQLNSAFQNGVIQYTEDMLADAVRITKTAGGRQTGAALAFTPEQMKQMSTMLSGSDMIGLEKVKTHPKAVIDPTLSTVAGMQVEERKNLTSSEVDLRSMFKKK